MIDLTTDSDEEDRARDDGRGRAGQVSAADEPPESVVEEVLSVLTHLDRKEAAELLRRNHCNPEDAINSAFAQA